MEPSKLKKILEQHKLWIETNGVQGTRANLSGADLYCADLGGADLTGANLTGADLRDANLICADLRGANLEGANLTDADLFCAKLSYANLWRANLGGAKLSGAYLSGAILPDISWIIPGCLAQLNHIKYRFWLEKEDKWDNFVQDSFGFFIQDNGEQKTFDILVGDRIIRGIPNWVKLSGMKQILS
jgi:hypothetical protein